MFGRVPGTRPNISESHSEISTRVPFCIVAGRSGAQLIRMLPRSGGVDGPSSALPRVPFSTLLYGEKGVLNGY